MSNTQTGVRFTAVGVDTPLVTSTKVVNYTDMVDGAIAIVDRANTRQSSVTNTATPLRVVVRNGTELLFSQEFTQAQVNQSTIQAGVATTQQVSYIGYNLTSGSIDTTAQTSYTIRMKMLEDGRTGQMSNESMMPSTYVSQSGDGQYEIALGLHNALAYKLNAKAHVDVKTERVYSGAVTNHVGTAANRLWTVQKGSRYATLTSDGTTAVTIGAGGTATDVLAGAYLDLAGLHYKIDSLYNTTTGVVKLDMPWQEESGFVLNNCATTPRTISVTPASKTATVSATVFANVPVGSVVYVNITDTDLYWHKGVTANALTGITFDDAYAGATTGAVAFGGGTAATGGNWGIRFMGQPGLFAVGKYMHRVPSFELYLSDEFETAAVTYDTAAVFGNGTGEQIAWDEWFTKGNYGNKHRKDFIEQSNYNGVAVSTTLYDQIDIKFKDSGNTSFQDNNTEAQIKIAVPANGTLVIGDITAVLAALTFA